MTNTALLLSMIEGYNALAYTSNYIYGFRYKGNIYMAFGDESVLAYTCKLEKASENQGMAVRYKPNPAAKLALLPSATLLCSAVYFEELVKSSKYNRGEIFEKLVTEYHGQAWEKDKIPFTDSGDIEINGFSYQIKYEKATLINEKTLMNLRGK